MAVIHIGQFRVRVVIECHHQAYGLSRSHLDRILVAPLMLMNRPAIAIQYLELAVMNMDFNARVVFGDNLPVLKSIPDKSVDLIYIDPPFSYSKPIPAFVEGQEKRSLKIIFCDPSSYE